MESEVGNTFIKLGNNGLGLKNHSGNIPKNSDKR